MLFRSSRVNAVNAMALNYSGERNLFVDPSCDRLIEDLEQVAWATGAGGTVTGDIDKTENPDLSHLSDALGYLIERECSVSAGPRSTVVA